MWTRLALPVLALAITACATGLMRNPGESDEDFAKRVHAAKVTQVERRYLIIDTAANLARANGVGSESFWNDYGKAEKIFLSAFALWKAGDLTQGDPVDVALAVLNALSEELARLPAASQPSPP